MTYTVSITSQGQLTIPMKIRKKLGIVEGTQAVVEEKHGELVVKPKKDFWSLGGSMQGDIKLTDEELEQASRQFEKDWARND